MTSLAAHLRNSKPISPSQPLPREGWLRTSDQRAIEVAQLAYNNRHKHMFITIRGYPVIVTDFLFRDGMCHYKFRRVSKSKVDR